MIDYLNQHHVYPDTQAQTDLNLHLPREVSNVEIKEARIENARIGTIGYVGAGKVGPNIYDLHFIDTLNQAMNEAMVRLGSIVLNTGNEFKELAKRMRPLQGSCYGRKPEQYSRAHYLSLHSKKFRTRKKWANWLQRRYES